MNSKEFKKQLTSVTPDMPEHFHHRMEMTLENIILQEDHMKESTKQAICTAGRFSSRAAALAVVLVMIAGAAALAATQWRVFDTVSFLTGKETPRNADSVMQGNLYQDTVNNVEITVKEAGYDGRTLLLQYSYRMLDVDKAFGDSELTEEFMSNLDDLSVGWWIDNLWIDGKAMDMPNNSGAVMTGSDVPGEIVITEYWRLDNENVKLNGPVEISLPIGEKQPLSEYGRKNHPEKYDADGKLKLPDKGVVTFTYEAKDVLSNIRILHPNEEKTLDEGAIKVSEAAFTPLMTYITLEMQVNSDAMSAYIAEHGEGHKDENGQVVFPYDGRDVLDDWLMSAELVDGQGTQVFPDHYGQNGYSSEWAEFLYPSMETIPDELYLAPIQDGVADMSRAVRVK